MARPGVAVLSRRRRKLGHRVHQPETPPLTQGDDPLRVAGGEGGVTVGVLVVVQQREDVFLATAAGGVEGGPTGCTLPFVDINTKASLY